jgi:membrane protein implicated in regulation of membrane protease activity
MSLFAIWAVVGLALLVAEIASSTFFAVFLAVGAFAAGLLAFVLPDSSPPIQAVVGVVVAGIGVVVVRPILSRRLLRRQPGTIGPGVHGGFVGQRALALDDIGDQLHPGHVRLAGETWLAITREPAAIGADAPVVITEVRGTTLVVRPAG